MNQFGSISFGFDCLWLNIHEFEFTDSGNTNCGLK